MADLSSLGACTASVWTRAAALRLLTDSQIEALLYDGTWTRVLPGIYADGGFTLSPVQWAFAAALASGLPDGEPERGSPVSAFRAVPCARTAARVWGIPLIDDDDPAVEALDRVNHDVAVWTRLAPLTYDDSGGAVHRRRLEMRGQDLVRHGSGLWLSSRERTLFDLTRFVSFHALVCAIDHQLRHGAVSRADLEQLARDLKRKRGAATFARAVALADERAESPAETIGRLLLLPVLPGLRPQVLLLDAGARQVARFDLGDEELRLAFETDGKAGHQGSAMAAKDHARDRRTSALGWHTERATWFELRRRPDEVVRRVVAAAEALRAGGRSLNAR